MRFRGGMVAALVLVALGGCVESGAPDTGRTALASTQSAAAAFEAICLASKPSFASAPALMQARGFAASADRNGYVWHGEERLAVKVSNLSNGTPSCVIRAEVPQGDAPAVSLSARYGAMREAPVGGLFYFEGKRGKVFYGPPYTLPGRATQSFEIGIIPGI